MKLSGLSLFALLLTTAVEAQITYKWEKVFISSDSLHPFWIGFVDSTTGYLFCHKYWNQPADINNKFRWKHIIYKTTNGGKQWIEESSHPFKPSDSEYVNKSGINWYQRSFYFPSSKSRYILIPQYDTTIIYPDPDGAVKFYNRWYLRSHDYGNNWESSRSDPWGAGISVGTQLITALGDKDLVFYCDTGSRRNHLFRSYDGGLTINATASDEVFARTIRPDTVGEWADSDADFFLEISDPFHWTAVVIRGGYYDSSSKDEFFKRFPRGLRTLVTSNSGKSWQVFTTPIAEQYDVPLCGDLQYIKGTPHLYYFSNWANNHEGHLGGNLARPMHGINFCYSSDYGKTWKIDTTFGWRRRAFEAVTKDELWFTLPKKETGRDDDPAYILTRSTDGGETYDFDSTTLSHFEQKLDGRIITFSDPRHGWIVATGDNHKDLFVLRYDANEQPKGVESEMYSGGYGHHYTLYPNPSHEFTTLNLYRYFYINEIKVFDILGTEVPLRYHIDGSKVEIDVRNLAIGHYTLRVRHNWGISVISLVVMR